MLDAEERIWHLGTRECEKENRARAKCVAAANRGWMSEKYPLPAGQEKCFYLTSPFIEPALFLIFEAEVLIANMDDDFKVRLLCFNLAKGHNNFLLFSWLKNLIGIIPAIGCQILGQR